MAVSRLFRQGEEGGTVPRAFLVFRFWGMNLFTAGLLFDFKPPLARKSIFTTTKESLETKPHEHQSVVLALLRCAEDQ